MPIHIPEISRCLELMEQFAMWENIRRHSFMVARVADRIVTSLSHADGCTSPNRELVIAGALLHDIAKSKCLEEGCRHAEVGAELCRDFGYPEVAQAVANHVILSRFERQKYIAGSFSHVELVFYADKRVRHDEVVSLDDRLEYILGKYAVSNPEYEAVIMKNFALCRELEDHIFNRLDIRPDELQQLVQTPSEDLSHYPPEPRRSAQP